MRCNITTVKNDPPVYFVLDNIYNIDTVVPGASIFLTGSTVDPEGFPLCGGSVVEDCVDYSWTVSSADVVIQGSTEIEDEGFCIDDNGNVDLILMDFQMI